MHQCLSFSTVFLVFVFLDVPIVVKSADTKDDEPNVKTDSAFSEVIKNITRVNNVLQDLIKNYEKLQKIYHSQESIEQHEYDEEENSSKYGNVKRSKDISTPGKSKNFPATNIPYSEVESEGSPEKTNKDNKILKSDEGRVPSVEALKNNNRVDKTKKKSNKAKPNTAKDTKPQASVDAPYTSDEVTDDKIAKEKKKTIEGKEVDEHEEIKNLKQSEQRTQQNLQAEQKALVEHESEEKLNVNSSDVKSEPATDTGKVIEKKVSLVIGDKKDDEGKGYAADSENEVQYEQRKRLDDNDKVFHRFATENKDDKEKSLPNLKSRYVQKPKKLNSNTTVRSSTKKKEKNLLRSSGKLSSQSKKNQKKVNSKKRSKKDVKQSPKKRTQKEDSPKASNEKEKGNKKKSENGGSSEDEKSIKKEQFKTSILRKAYGDACLKVVVKKCYKACKSTLKHGSRKYKCTSNFQLQFKEHAKTGCIREFRETPSSTTTPPTTVVKFESDKRALKAAEEKPKVKARDTDKNINGFLDLTRNGYLAAACLPKTRRTEAAPGRSDQQLNILRDRFERECQKVSSSKCTNACSYAVEQTCLTHNCPPEKKKGLKKICCKECKESYRANPKKSRSSGSKSGSGSDSGSSGSSGSGSGSGSDSDSDNSDSSKSKEDKKKSTHEATTVTTHESIMEKTTRKDETMRMRASDKQDETRLTLRVVDTKS